MRTNARGDVDGASGLEPATTARDRRLTVARRAAITAWALALVYRTLTNGFAVQPELLLLYIVTGLTAASIGRHHKVLLVVRDWLPFALVLVLYDFSRGAARLVGRPTLWQLQPEVDRWLCFGAVPTGLVAGAPQDARAVMVGGDHQHGIHVVFHRPLRSRRMALDA